MSPLNPDMSGLDFNSCSTNSKSVQSSVWVSGPVEAYLETFKKYSNPTAPNIIDLLVVKTC
jgi:hypothetical protein